MAGIELRLSNVDPPNPDPLRTIYRDIVNLPDPVKLGITIRYFNYDDVGLYFRITGQGTGYTFGTVNLGLLASGANAFKNLDEFASRSKPSAGDLPQGEKQESITLILRAYTDSGYTNLKWTYEKVVTVHWINSNDPAFTQDFVNNFDDGTVQGWAGYSNFGTITLVVATDYVLSTPYSLRGTGQAGYDPTRFGFYKQFTTPNREKVFAIINVRGGQVGGTVYFARYQIQKDSEVLVHLGRAPPDTAEGGITEDFVPKDKWLRIVVLLPKNTTLTVRVYTGFRPTVGTYQGRFWMDDFMIISKG